jgi:glycosyltransferase involved in cell wall biosynthesis
MIKVLIFMFFLIFLILLIYLLNKKNIKENFLGNKNIIHYCVSSYDIRNYGGVARYDYQIKKVFPNRKFFKAQESKNKLLKFLKENPESLVITDNHLACDIPNKYKVLLVHHGTAITHKEREPSWGGRLANLCINGQKKMLNFRNPENTKIISISQFCTDEFIRLFPKRYNEFPRELILHSSEFDEGRYKKKFNDIPVILGNWSTENKGLKIYDKLKNKDKYYFKKLSIGNDNNDINDFNKRKQDIYLNSDMFLQISLCEGSSYSALDAVLCGLVLVSTDTGFCYKDMPENCFVKLDWRRNNDINYVQSKIDYAWKNREELSKNARKWYMENCRFKDWEKKMKKIVNNF